MNETPSVSGILSTARSNFMQTAKRLALNPPMVRKLSAPQERIEISANPCLSDGSVVNVRGYIVRYCDSLGPSKGGIRMSPDVTLDDVTGLAMEMTWKTAPRSTCPHRTWGPRNATWAISGTAFRTRPACPSPADAS